MLEPKNIQTLFGKSIGTLTFQRNTISTQFPQTEELWTGI